MLVAVPIDPEKLLVHADDLVQHHAGGGRPRSIWLRRAVSASYYAVFHDLGRALARHLLPEGRHDDQLRLTRSVDHGRIADVCAWIGEQKGAGKEHVRPIIAGIRSNASVLELASIFANLYAARQRADYDHLAHFGKADALSYVAQARRGVQLIDSLSPTPDGQRLLALIGLHSSLR